MIPDQQPAGVSAWPVGLLLGDRDFSPSVSKIAVIGGGTMGPGIAQTFAMHGFEVALCDLREDVAQAALHAVRDSLDLQLSQGIGTEAAIEAAMSRITVGTHTAAALRDAHLVIEAVTENKAVKAAVFEQVMRDAPPTAVVWSNTSSLDVFALAPPSLLARLLVAHWFAPAEIIPLVEVVGPPSTGPEPCKQTIAVLKALGKVPVKLHKFVPGFVINRLQRALGNEILFLLSQGVISAHDMDVAVRSGLAPRMQVLGVVQRYDFTGLNLSLRNLQDPDFQDAPADKSPPLLTSLVERGALGVSTGEGFYHYGELSRKYLHAERDRMLLQVIASLGPLVTDPRPVGTAPEAE
jgi:3-hydroxybutyryl-CoA dehydrogenase